MGPLHRTRQASAGSTEEGRKEPKKCGAKNSDPNRYSQPRLPGSVVGEASMRRIPKPHKITKVIPQVTRLAAWKRFRQQRKALSLFSCMDASRWKLFYFAATSECVMA